MTASSIATRNGFPIERLENRIAPAGFIFAAGHGVVSVFADPQQDKNYEDMTDSFIPFANYKGPILVAAGDFDGDGNDELITAKGAGPSPVVKIWDVSSGGIISGLIDSFVPFAGKTRGVSVAAGDLNNDGAPELFVGAGPGGPPTVKIYSDIDSDSLLSDNLVDTFTAFAGTFTGGVKLASANTNNSGGDELIAGAWSKGGMVQIFTDSNANRQLSDADSTPFEQASPFGMTYKGGLNLAAGSIQSAGSGGAEVMIAKPKGAPIVLIYTDSNFNGTVFEDPLFDTLLAGGAGAGKGATVAVGDSDLSGSLVEVMTAPASAKGNTIRIFDDSADAGSLLSDDAPLTFQAFPSSFSGGINLAFGKVRSETFASTEFPQTISDVSTTQSKIFVPSDAGIIRDLDISIDLFHSFDGDLDVTLTHVASGTTLILFTDVGGTNEGFMIRLNDESGTDISTASNPKLDGPITGTFNPGGTALLSVFDLLDASGEWVLSITDDSGGDTGTLFNWKLDINY